MDKINGNFCGYSYNTDYRGVYPMVAGWLIMAVTLGMDFFVYVAIQLYFEGHPAFNDKAEINEKINDGNRTSSGLQQYDLF